MAWCERLPGARSGGAAVLRRSVQGALAPSGPTAVEGAAGAGARWYGSGANTKKKSKDAGPKRRQTKVSKKDTMSRKEAAAHEAATESRSKPLVEFLLPQEKPLRQLSEEEAAREEDYVRAMTRRVSHITRKQDNDVLRKMRLRDEALAALPPALRPFASRADYAHFPPGVRAWTHTPPKTRESLAAERRAAGIGG